LLAATLHWGSAPMLPLSSRRLASFLRLLLVACSLTTFAGCALAAPSAPSPSTPTRTTDTFEGSFKYQGSAAHAFTVTEAGSVEVRVTALSPLSTMAIGTSVGTWNGTSCTAANIRNDNARVGAAALSGTTQPGDYCVNLYDSGNVPSTWTVTYTVEVTHP
jgi:hypothetical protein